MKMLIIEKLLGYIEIINFRNHHIYLPKRKSSPIYLPFWLQFQKLVIFLVLNILDFLIQLLQAFLLLWLHLKLKIIPWKIIICIQTVFNTVEDLVHQNKKFSSIYFHTFSLNNFLLLLLKCSLNNKNCPLGFLLRNLF